MNAAEHIEGSDPAGLITLERISAAKRLNRWFFSAIAPYCKGHVLEVGSGIGNISREFLAQQFPLTMSDLRPEYCAVLESGFKNDPNYRGVVQLNLVAEDFDNRYAHLLGQFDTVIALNVIEHIQNDQLAVSNCKKLLKTGGHLVILVPAYQQLYNVFDVELGHFVRYNSGTLTALLESAGLAVMQTRYFNAAGIFGWWLNGTVRKKKLIPQGQLQLFDKLVPVLKWIDKLTLHSIGLSVIGAARKPG